MLPTARDPKGSKDMRDRRSCGGGPARGLLATLLAVVVVASGVPGLAQEPTPEDLRRLQSLDPQERARLLEQLGQGAAADGSDPAGPIDDRFTARPLGAPDPADSLQTVPATLEVEDGNVVPRVRFGQSLFSQAPVFTAPTFGPVPADYRLGPGDMLVVQVWGDVQQRRQARVDRDGTVVLRDVGKVPVGGRTLEAAKAEITTRLAQVLSGIDPDGDGSTQVDVTLGELRAIQVFVVGEVARPAGYEVGAVSTVFQALYAAGGPSAIGSMREIQLIRDNRVIARLDLYDILLRGTREGDVGLRDGDTVFVPVARTSVWVEGEVRRPAIYELRGDEGLSDAIRYAGGLTPAARADVAHVRRILPPAERPADGAERVDLDLPFADNPPLVDGDEVVVRAVNPREERYVLVGGSVVNPGRYGYRPGMRVTDLLERSRGVWRDALLDRALVVRVRDDYTRESFPIDLRELIPGHAQDLVLAPLDSLHVFSREVLLDRRLVTIHGEVENPGEYPFFDQMSVRDLVLAAGGLLDSADPRAAEVSRVDPRSGEQASLATVAEVPLDDGSDAASRWILENHDHVFVRTIPGYELQRNVSLSGEVRYPGVYTLLHREERLSEVIQRAGGLLETAYPEGFRLYRAKEGVGNLGLDLRRALDKPGSTHDVILAAGDRVEIPPTPMSVKVVGQVGFPTSVLWQKGRSIGDYVASAGGFTRLSDEGRTKVIYPNGLSAKVRRWWRDPSVQPGSTIFVPERDPDEGVDWGDVIVGTTQVLSSLATIYLVIDRAGN